MPSMGASHGSGMGAVGGSDTGGSGGPSGGNGIGGYDNDFGSVFGYGQVDAAIAAAMDAYGRADDTGGVSRADAMAQMDAQMRENNLQDTMAQMDAQMRENNLAPNAPLATSPGFFDALQSLVDFRQQPFDKDIAYARNPSLAKAEFAHMRGQLTDDQIASFRDNPTAQSVQNVLGTPAVRGLGMIAPAPVGMAMTGLNVATSPDPGRAVGNLASGMLGSLAGQTIGQTVAGPIGGMIGGKVGSTAMQRGFSANYGTPGSAPGIVGYGETGGARPAISGSNQAIGRTADNGFAGEGGPVAAPQTSGFVGRTSPFASDRQSPFA